MISSASSSQPLPLWHSEAPGALGQNAEHIPTLSPYLPSTRANDAAFVVCPGGGYGSLAAHEGENYALWLNTLGIAAFVLKYRLGTHGYRHPRMLEDAARAVRLVRAQSEEWNLNRNRIGIMGSSAGGHLAATLLTNFDEGKLKSNDPIDRESSRPDLGVLCYAVTTMGAGTHEGSKKNLLGENPAPDLVDLLSCEKHVSPQTPPCFIWHTAEDPAVKVENALDFAAALHRNGVPYDLHIYQKGRHGLGLADEPPFENAHPWTQNLSYWLKENGFVS